jgi:hypothetical protein
MSIHGKKDFLQSELEKLVEAGGHKIQVSVEEKSRGYTITYQRGVDADVIERMKAVPDEDKPANWKKAGYFDNLEAYRHDVTVSVKQDEIEIKSRDPYSRVNEFGFDVGQFDDIEHFSAGGCIFNATGGQVTIQRAYTGEIDKKFVEEVYTMIERTYDATSLIPLLETELQDLE